MVHRRRQAGCFTSDNVQVVLAGGHTVHANATSHADLYKALKGGSNNLGVVTRLDLRMVFEGSFWGGMGYYNASVLPDLFRAFTKFAGNDAYDSNSQLTMLYGLYQNNTVVMTHQHYTKLEVPPEIVFGDFNDLQMKNTFRISNMTDFATELQSPAEKTPIRKSFGTITFKNSEIMLQRFHNLTESTFAEIRAVAGLQFILSFQPFGPIITGKATATGGNYLGLDRGNTDRVIICLTVSWAAEEDDEIMEHAIKSLLKQADLQAKELGLEDQYVFQNYATHWQDVYGGIGEDNLKAWQEISNRYDPLQIFQNAVPGGFKFSKRSAFV